LNCFVNNNVLNVFILKEETKNDFEKKSSIN
jgi:hypothetical protein